MQRRFAAETTSLTETVAVALFKLVPIPSVLPSADAHTSKSSRLGVTTCVKLTGGCVSWEDNKKGVSSGSALANADADALMSGVVGSFQEMEPFAPALMAMMTSIRNSAPVGLRDQNL